MSLWAALSAALLVIASLHSAHADTCRIQAKAFCSDVDGGTDCTATDSDTNGYIRVNGNNLRAWTASGAKAGIFYAVVLDENCNFLNPLDIPATSDSDFGGFVDGASDDWNDGDILIAASQDNLEDMDFTDTDLIDFMVGAFGLDIVSQNELPSENGGIDPTGNGDIETFLFVLQVNKPSNSWYKISAGGFGARDIDIDLYVPDLQCVDSLPPFDIFREGFLGITNPTDSMVLSDDQECFTKVDFTTRLQCDGKLRGWEYYPYSDQAFVAQMFFYNGGQAITVRANTKTTINPGGQQSHAQYHCLATPQDVSAGDLFGVSYPDITDCDVPGIYRTFVSSTDAVQFPCSEILTTDTAARVLGWNADETDDLPYVRFTDRDFDTLAEPASTDSTSSLMQLGLRPIIDEDFVFHCFCRTSVDCQAFGDQNMLCGEGCYCREDFQYNRKHNRCLNTNWARDKGEQLITASTPSSDIHNALQTIDDNESGEIATGTCYISNEMTDPFWTYDFESYLTVYAVEITPITPLDTRARVYVAVAQPEDLPSENLFAVYNELTEGPPIEKIIIYGPWPWRLTDTDGNSFVINRDVSFGKETFGVSDFGPLGDQVEFVNRLEYVGTLTHDGKCIMSGVGQALTFGVIDDDCIVFYLVEDLSTTPNTINAYVLNGDHQDLNLRLENSLDDALASLGSTTTALRFHQGDAGVPSTTPHNTLQLALEDMSGFTISLSTTPGTCLRLDVGGTIVLDDTDCDLFSIQLHPNIDLAYPRYTYVTKTLTGGNGEIDLSADADVNYDTVPCIQIMEGFPGAVVEDVDDIDEGYFDVQGFERSGFGETSDVTSDGDVTLRTNDLGIHNFEITGEGGTIMCYSTYGYLPNGQPTVLNCDKPMTVQDLKIKIVSGDADESLQICDVKIFVLEKPGYDAPCLDDEDCVGALDMDQHLSCSVSAGYRCRCHPGYRYWEDANLCINIDECLPDPSNGAVLHTCISADSSLPGSEDGDCVDELGTYNCVCPDGMYWEHGMWGCSDINECDDMENNPSNNAGCAHVCSNLVVDADSARYVCSCRDGYELDEENFHDCNDIDECADLSTHLCEDGTVNVMGSGEEEVQGICVNTIGEYYCNCEDGYAWKDTLCEDIDECDMVPSYCEHGNENCENTPGSFICSCMDGFKLLDDAVGCQDVDECAEGGENLCNEVNGTCHNELGTYRCSCDEGFQLSDLFDCEDFDECSVNNGMCMHECDNSIGSYECSCDDGFYLMDDNHSCDDQNECELDPDVCDQKCMNTPGSYECGCWKGYKLNEDIETCDNVDECEEMANGGCDQGCVDSIGSFTCTCIAGYYLADNKVSCFDEDECVLGTDTCAQICINIEGSYKCLCDGAFRGGSQMSSCILGRAVSFGVCLTPDWNIVYNDMNDPVTRALAFFLEQGFLNTLAAGSMTARKGNFIYQVTDFYETEGKVCCNVVAMPQTDISDPELAVFASEVGGVLSASAWTLGDETVEVVGNPTVGYYNGLTDASAVLSGPCDYWDLSDYCGAGGECYVDDGLPLCSCVEGFSGRDGFCIRGNSSGLSDMEIGLIAGFSGLFVLMMLVGVCLCLMYNRRMPRQQPQARGYVEEYPEYQPTGVEQPTYMSYKSWGFPYGGPWGSAQQPQSIYGNY